MVYIGIVVELFCQGYKRPEKVSEEDTLAPNSLIMN